MQTENTWPDSHEKSPGRLEFEKGIIDAHNKIEQEDRNKIEQELKTFNPDNQEMGGEQELKQWLSDLENMGKVLNIVPLRVKNISKEPQQVRLFDPQYSEAWIEIKSIYNSISYGEMLRILPLMRLQVFKVRVEQVTVMGVDVNTEAPILKSYPGFVTKQIDGSTFTVPLVFNKQSYEKQLIKSVIEYGPLRELFILMHGLTYITITVPAETEIMVSVYCKGRKGFLNSSQ